MTTDEKEIYVLLLNIALSKRLDGKYAVTLELEDNHLNLIAINFKVENAIKENYVDELFQHEDPTDEDVQWVYEQILREFIKENEKQIELLKEENEELYDLVWKRINDGLAEKYK